MKTLQMSRRTALSLGVKLTAAYAIAGGSASRLRAGTKDSAGRRVFDVADYGATGTGTVLDTESIQRAVDEASAAGERSQSAAFRGGKRYLIGSLVLKSGIDFHLADDAEVIISTDQNQFLDGTAISARGATGLSITGTGTINGRSPEYMDHFDSVNEWWRPKGFFPRVLALVDCRDLVVRDITLAQSPSWTMHLQGLRGGRWSRGIKIRNRLDVPNCDGDRCRPLPCDLEIKNCDIVCRDDGIVVKNTRQGLRYGPSSRIRVSDCVIVTQDSGLKI